MSYTRARPRQGKPGIDAPHCPALVRPHRDQLPGIGLEVLTA